MTSKYQPGDVVVHNNVAAGHWPSKVFGTSGYSIIGWDCSECGKKFGSDNFDAAMRCCPPEVSA